MFGGHRIVREVSGHLLICCCVPRAVSRVSHVYPSFGMFTQGKAAWQLIDSLPELEYLKLLQLDDTVWEFTPHLSNLRRMRIESHFHLTQVKHWNLNRLFPGLMSLQLPFSSCANQDERQDRSRTLVASEAITCDTLQDVTIDFGSSVQHLAAVTSRTSRWRDSEKPQQENLPEPDFALYRWMEHSSSDILGRTVPAQTDIKQRLVLGAGLHTVTLNIDYIILFRKFGVLVSRAGAVHVGIADVLEIALLDGLGTGARPRCRSNLHQYPSQDFTCGIRSFILLLRSRSLCFRCRLVLSDTAKRCRVDRMRGGARKTVLQSESR
jgi:hypothetical protein